MRVKLSHFERVAGLFVVIAFGGAVVLTGLAAIQQGWFASKIYLETEVESADGLHAGTAVHVAGLRAGEVIEVELQSAEKVRLKFEILEKFQKNIREDSVVQIIRPFILGEKVVEVSVGSQESPMIITGQKLKATPGFDLMELVSGKTLGPFMGDLQGLMKNLSTLAKAFADPKRTKAFIKMFDRVDPLIISLGHMSNEVTKLSKGLNDEEHLKKLVQRLDRLTKVIEPAMAEIGPELPRVSRRTVEALDEMVVTLKAIQKSFLLSGKVEDVREEEKKRQRQPAEE